MCIHNFVQVLNAKGLPMIQFGGEYKKYKVALLYCKTCLDQTFINLDEENFQ